MTDNEIEEYLEAEAEDQKEDDIELQQDLNEQYGFPSQDSVYNQHAFLHHAAFNNPDTLRTTFLSREELGRPLFSVRFMLDMQKMALNQNFIASTGKSINLKKIADYWKQKTMSITDSGMSFEGFSMNLNSTQKKETTKKRYRDISGLRNQRKVKDNPYEQYA